MMANIRNTFCAVCSVCGKKRQTLFQTGSVTVELQIRVSPSVLAHQIASHIGKEWNWT